MDSGDVKNRKKGYLKKKMIGSILNSGCFSSLLISLLY